MLHHEYAPLGMSDQNQNSKEYRAEQIRLKIRTAALEVFSDHGYQGSSINKIAEAASMSTPRLLYYYKGKQDLYVQVLRASLEMWLTPLKMISKNGDPQTEIFLYIKRKLFLAQAYPRESRLFAMEVLAGLPIVKSDLAQPLKKIFEDKVNLVNQWISEKKIIQHNPHHLFYSIWATTQHYADFEAQIELISGDEREMVFEEAEKHLLSMFRGWFIDPS